jgi:hypothetical protein
MAEGLLLDQAHRLEGFEGAAPAMLSDQVLDFREAPRMPEGGGDAEHAIHRRMSPMQGKRDAAIGGRR